MNAVNVRTLAAAMCEVEHCERLLRDVAALPCLRHIALAEKVVPLLRLRSAAQQLADTTSPLYARVSGEHARATA